MDGVGLIHGNPSLFCFPSTDDQVLMHSRFKKQAQEIAALSLFFQDKVQAGVELFDILYTPNSYEIGYVFATSGFREIEISHPQGYVYSSAIASGMPLRQKPVFKRGRTTGTTAGYMEC
jgi:hypothetical protein